MVVCVIFHSVARTPLSGVVVRRRSKSKGYRQSYRSCLGAASRLITPGFTVRKLSTIRKAPKSHDITVSRSEPLLYYFTIYFCCIKHNESIDTCLCFPATGQSAPRASVLTAEGRMEAVVRHSSVSVQTHTAQELLQAALCLHCRREAARPGGGGGGIAEQFQSILLRAAGDDRDRGRCRDHPHTSKQDVFKLDLESTLCDTEAAHC